MKDMLVKLIQLQHFIFTVVVIFAVERNEEISEMEGGFSANCGTRWLFLKLIINHIPPGTDVC